MSYKSETASKSETCDSSMDVILLFMKRFERNARMLSGWSSRKIVILHEIFFRGSRHRFCETPTSESAKSETRFVSVTFLQSLNIIIEAFELDFIYGHGQI